MQGRAGGFQRRIAATDCLCAVPIKGKGHWFLVYCTVYPWSGKLYNAVGWYAEIGSNTHSPLKFTLLLFYPKYISSSIAPVGCGVSGSGEGPGSGKETVCSVSRYF